MSEKVGWHLSHIYTVHEYLFGTRREPERMLRNQEESSARFQITSRIFQCVEGALGMIFQRYSIQHSMEVLESARVKVVSFKHGFPQKEISLKLSKPCISDWFVALHSSNAWLIF
jgi:hypothetical protein